MKKVIESYRKPLELIKEGIGNIDTESEHGKSFIAEAQKVIDTLIENLPNVQKMYEEMEEKFGVLLQLVVPRFCTLLLPLLAFLFVCG